MKGWSLVNPKNLQEKEINESDSINSCKVKITKALITLRDILRYNGEIKVENNTIIGSYGIGVLSEQNPNLFGLEKGQHVYIEPSVPCDDNVNLKTDNKLKIPETLTAGEDFDGFLADFISINSKNLYNLPESVSDFDALFIGHIALAVSIIDKLKIQKGDYVSIVGANNFGNILSQLLIYYQAVPILLSDDDEDLEIAKNSGIYYTIGSNDNWQKEVSNITGGRMTKNVVYICDCNISTYKAFSLASFNAEFAFTGVYDNSNQFSFNQALKKQLEIHCISNGYGNTATAINLLANKAIDTSHLKLETCLYNEIPEAIENMSKKHEENQKIFDTVVDLI